MTEFWRGFLAAGLTLAVLVPLYRLGANALASGQKKRVAKGVLPTSKVTAHAGKDGSVKFTDEHGQYIGLTRGNHQGYVCPVCRAPGTSFMVCDRPDCADGR